MSLGTRLAPTSVCLAVGLLGQTLGIDPPFQCGFLASPPTIVRAEGVSERVGDVLIACSGGTPTQIGAQVPQFNLRIFFNAPVTSRQVATFSEALLLVDEPNSPANPQSPLRLCGDRNTNESPTNPGVCTMTGRLDENTYSGTNPDPGISPNNRPNVFQARQVAANAIEFAGVPIDPVLPRLFPSRFPYRLLRITNLRVNPRPLGEPEGFEPKQVVAFLSISGRGGPDRLALPTQTVAYVQATVRTEVQDRAKLLRCEARNSSQAAFTVRMTENFPGAFKALNSAQQSDPDATTYPAVFANQNIPGASYEAEDGFINTTSALGRRYADPQGLAFPDIRGMRSAGAADTGTRVSIQIRDVPQGTRILVPGVVTLRSKHGAAPTGRAVLVADTGPFSPRLTDENGFVEITATATYEVLRAEPFDTEQLDVPVSVVYDARVPQVGIGSTVSAGSSTRDDTRATRFDAFTIESCDCNLLFPVVSNRNGYDTGIAISNTGPDEGVVTLHYFCGTDGCSSPPAQTTAQPVAAGKQVTFTLSGGGGPGIAAVPGFQGYLVARAEFRYCHGFAMLSAFNALANSSGQHRAYLALVLDRPVYREGVAFGENLGR